MLVLGIIIVSIAPWLSKKIAFFYISGVTLGIFLSIAILFFFVTRRFSPQSSSIWSATVATLFQTSLASFAWLWMSIESFIYEYMDYILGYVIASGLISLALVHYSIGGSEGVRPELQDVVCWSFRLVGVTLMLRATSSARWSLLFASSLFTFPIIQIFADSTESLFWGILCCHLCRGGSHRHGENQSQKSNGADPSFVVNRMSNAEYEAIGKKKTLEELDKLANTPVFADWIKSNHNRLLAKSPEFDGGDSDDTGNDSD
jgi:hypothetical protein